MEIIHNVQQIVQITLAKLPSECRIIYEDIKKRIGWSKKNGDTWKDTIGRVFCTYSGDDFADLILKHPKTARKYKRMLIDAGLIEEKRLGQGKVNRYYLTDPTQQQAPVLQIVEPEPVAEKSHTASAQSSVPEGKKCAPIYKELDLKSLSSRTEEDYAVTRARVYEHIFDRKPDLSTAATEEWLAMEVIDYGLPLHVAKYVAGHMALEDVHSSDFHAAMRKFYGNIDRIHTMGPWLVSTIQEEMGKSAMKRRLTA